MRPTLYDKLQDDAISISGDSAWNVSGDAVVPKVAGEAVMIEGKATAPATPSADKIKTYAVVTGISPNKLVKFCVQGEDGSEIILFTVTV